MSQSTDQNLLKSVNKAFQIVELLYEEDGLILSDVASTLNMAKSSSHRYLKTLEHNGYAVEENGVYYPGLNFLTVGWFVRHRKEAYKLARPKVEQLAEQTNERAEFIVEEHGQGIFVHHETGENAVTTDTHVGTQIPLHATAAGKAILAFYSTDRVREIVNRQGLPEFTQQTITDVDILLSELEDIRQKTIAYNKGEIIPGLRAVGVPITTETNSVVGALSITGPADRLKGETFTEEFPELLRGAAKEIELNLAYG